MRLSPYYSYYDDYLFYCAKRSDEIDFGTLSPTPRVAVACPWLVDWIFNQSKGPRKKGRREEGSFVVLLLLFVFFSFSCSFLPDDQMML